MKRIVVFVVAGLAVLAALLLVVRVQPAGSALVARRGDSVRSVAGRIAVLMPGGQRCVTPVTGGRARFDRTYAIEDAGGETIQFAVRFDYAFPRHIPAGWPSGTWCSSLDARVAESVKMWVAAADVDLLRRDPRGA